MPASNTRSKTEEPVATSDTPFDPAEFAERFPLPTVPISTPPEPRAENVVEALQRVMRDLPAIGKDQQAAPEQGGYAYRGIEQITQHAQVLLARHGVTFVPHVLGWERAEVLVGSREKKVWHDELLRVEYTVYGPGGATDNIIVGPIAAIGRDGSDKGVNKAMTQAFKYALLQTLCISDKADDADGTTVEAEGPAVPPDPETTPMYPEQARAIRDRVRELRALDVNEVDGVALSQMAEDGTTVVLGTVILYRDDESGGTRPGITIAAANDLLDRLAQLLRIAQGGQPVEEAPSA